ncbi:TetR/AcrR family transcriptional regulator [Fulvivirgaceae bacterium BMA12]|uniref:TetR/AcrR family transcriptional regulator n=1 Tax=Agaribacillus aureus TaxID=3051825 RepID=A0ABT8L3I6_9BACT|nr:TetR/AcrR family transcriptional regulator [Fulvivirgaceae bacterium BMA12]
MSISVQITIDENLFLKDPQESKLGKKAIKEGISLLDEIGLEAFTFKKLATRMGSTEATIYRYFENKHLFLVYLLSWYWEWMRFRIDFNSMNIVDPHEKIKIVIKTIVDTVRLSTPAEYIDRDALHRIVVVEGPKAYHIKQVDKENKQGYFKTLKALNKKIADILLVINPKFPYPKALASNLLEMGNDHFYYAQHLPGLTDINLKNGSMDELEQLMEFYVFRLLGKS